MCSECGRDEFECDCWDDVRERVDERLDDPRMSVIDPEYYESN